MVVTTERNAVVLLHLLVWIPHKNLALCKFLIGLANEIDKAECSCLPAGQLASIKRSMSNVSMWGPLCSGALSSGPGGQAAEA